MESDIQIINIGAGNENKVPRREASNVGDFRLRFRLPRLGK